MLNPDEMYLTDDQYVAIKKQNYKQKQLNKRIRESNKALRGFGYNYNPVKLEQLHEYIQNEETNEQV